MTKRWKILIITFTVITVALVGRLVYIQIAGHEDLSAAAYAQQQIVLNGADTRGTIYDRNGNPIAGQQQEYIYIIEEKNFDGETMNALNQLNAKEVPGQKGAYRVFTSETYLKSTGERLIRNSDAYILEAGRRYQENQSAVHMIGYINQSDSSGASGLEVQYDDILSMLNKKVSTTADINGQLLRGKGLTVTTAADTDSYIKDGITTTLDLTLQKKVEEIMGASDKKGAAIVTKSDTGEILASVSTPGFDPGKVEEHMKSNDGELINKVTQGEYPPGSVFKIVVAAVALESGISPDEVFSCSGSETIDGRTVACNTGGETGHGSISFADAFADSCNCAFIQMAQRVGADAIIDMARKMGLGDTVLSQYPGEKSGNLMTSGQSTGAAIANLALGQGQTLVTPLQVAKMTGIIANGGLDTNLSIVMGQDEIQVTDRCISEETAKKLQKMMKKTMLTGTGKGLKSDISMAAKTGSAESMQAGVEVVHGWITGYVPAESPEYVITVFVEDGRSGSGAAGPLFAEIAQYLGDSHMIQYEIGF